MLTPKIDKSYLQLHGAVFLFGFAAILGDLIHLTAVVLVWWRLFITIVSLSIMVNFISEIRRTPVKYLLRWSGIGVLVSTHWIFFFASIKWSNASVALVCLATATVFTSFIEPWIYRTLPKLLDIVIALLVIPCMILIVSDLELGMMAGVWAGLVSAALLSLFGVLNKKLVHKGNPVFITFVELSAGCLFTGIFLVFFKSPSDPFIPKELDWIYLILLALGCTTLGYVLVLHALKNLSAYTTMLAFNLEPVYGMLFAYFILDDASELSPSFYLGGLLIIALIFIHPIVYRKLNKATNQYIDEQAKN